MLQLPNRSERVITADSRRILGASIAAGAVGAWLGIPMSALGTAFIGNPWALGMFGAGLLASGYSVRLTGWSPGAR
ncbi:MAG: hypothetical protein U0163_15410 [Gemmatimonadaceae bacterium]